MVSTKLTKGRGGKARSCCPFSDGSKGRAACLLVALLLALACLAPGTARAITRGEVEGRLSEIRQRDEGTYWTTDGQPSDSSGSTSRSYYGIQCKGYASMVFAELFGGGYIGSYSSDKSYIPSPNGAEAIYCTVAGTLSTGDGGAVSAAFSGAAPGDFVQMRRRGKSNGHSQIVYGVDEGGVTFLDCNADGHCLIQVYRQTWATFCSKNSGFSIYRADGYDPTPVSVNYPPVGYVDGWSGGLGEIRISGWAYDPNDPGESIGIHIYVGGPAGSGAPCYATMASSASPDVNTNMGISGNHRFHDIRVPAPGGDVSVYVYVIDTWGGHNPVIANGEFTVNVEAAPPTSGARNVKVGAAEYKVQSKIGGRFLCTPTGPDGSASLEDGANVFVTTDTGSNISPFNVGWMDQTNGYCIQSIWTGKHLDAEGGNSARVANVSQYWWVGSNLNQTWLFEDAGDGWVYIKNRLGYYLDVQDGADRDGANVRVCAFNGSDAQKWKLVTEHLGEAVTDVPEGTYEIEMASAPDVLLDIADMSDAEGANLWVCRRNGSDAQRFRLERNGDGSYVITNVHSNRSLDVYWARPDNDTNVIQSQTHRGDNQSWWLERADGGAYFLRAKHSGLYLDVQGGKTANGTNVEVCIPNGGDAQRFLLTRLDGDGWVDLGGGRKCYRRGGQLVTGWMDIDGAKYWFGSDGVMATGWTDVVADGKTYHYYFNPASGNLVRNTWFQIDGKTYYFRPSGNLATGWATISDNGVDKKYYLDGDGQLVTGWRDIDNGQGQVNRYYFRPSGSMATGWATIDGQKYWFRPSGNMATGFTTVDDGYKRYFDAQGQMLVGWQQIDGKTFYFRASGAMQTGRATIDGQEYEFTASGTLKSGTVPAQSDDVASLGIQPDDDAVDDAEPADAQGEGGSVPAAAGTQDSAEAELEAGPDVDPDSVGIEVVDDGLEPDGVVAL